MDREPARMKKLMIVLVLALSLIGCSGGGDAADGQNTPVPVETTTTTETTTETTPTGEATATETTTETSTETTTETSTD